MSLARGEMGEQIPGEGRSLESTPEGSSVRSGTLVRQDLALAGKPDPSSGPLGLLLTAGSARLRVGGMQEGAKAGGGSTTETFRAG